MGPSSKSEGLVHWVRGAGGAPPMYLVPPWPTWVTPPRGLPPGSQAWTQQPSHVLRVHSQGSDLPLSTEDSTGAPPGAPGGRLSHCPDSATCPAVPTSAPTGSELLGPWPLIPSCISCATPHQRPAGPLSANLGCRMAALADRVPGKPCWAQAVLWRPLLALPSGSSCRLPRSHPNTARSRDGWRCSCSAGQCQCVHHACP